MSKPDDSGCAACIIPILGILIAPAVWLTMSFFEARAFNRATGSDVSMWEAAFVTLRVEGRAE